MSKNVNHLQHIKSSVVENGKPKLPSSSVLVEGELAVNYANGYETISLKNLSGNIVTFSSDNYYTEQKLGSGFTGANSAITVTDVIEENEQAIAAALNDLNDNKLDASAYTPTDLSDYYTKEETSGKTQLSTAFGSKVNSATFTAHTANTNVHVTTAQTASWDAKVDVLALSGYADAVTYNDTTHYIEFYHGGTSGTKVFELSAAPFIVDGMVQNVEIKDVTSGASQVTCLVVSFNTDAGKQDINIPLTDIFNANNYYTKTQIDNLVGSGFTSSSITDVIVENEEITATALNDLNANKLGLSTFESYSGSVASSLSNKVNNSTYTAYTASTESKINYVSGAVSSLTTTFETVSTTALTASVGKYYNCASVGTLNITLPTPSGNQVTTISFFIQSGANPAVTFTSQGNSIYLSDGFLIEANSTYEVNALWNGTYWLIAMVKLELSV